MYKHTLKTHGHYLTQEQELPKNSSAEGNGTAIRLSGNLGAIELAMVADTECTLHANTSITLSLTECATEHGTYTPASVRTTYTPTEDKTWNAGEIILRLPIASHMKQYSKAVLATTDASAVGTVSVVPTYLPR